MHFCKMVNRNYILLGLATLIFIAIFSQIVGFAPAILSLAIPITFIINQRSTVDFCAEYVKPVEKVQRKERIIYVSPEIQEETEKKAFVPTVGFLPHSISEMDYQGKYKNFQHCYNKIESEFKRFEQNDSVFFEQDLKAKYELMDEYKNIEAENKN